MKQSSDIAINTIVKSLVASNARIIFGYIIAIFCGLIAIIGVVNTGLSPFDITMVTIFFVFMALGILQIVRGKKHKKLVTLFKEYAARLATDPNHSIHKLAAATGATAEAVKENILKMIHKGYFVNAYIDFERNCLVFSQDNSSAQQAESSAEYVRISCPGCGAKNKIQKGTVGECEFCGSYLSQG
jgi:ribosomal protein S27E